MNQGTNSNLVIHLKYCIVIFVVVNCIVGGLALYNQKIAIAGLSNAGLLLSIVLAVVAILITLWDVAGQKNSITDLRNVSKSLNESSDAIVVSVDSLKLGIDEVTIMKNELYNKIETVNASIKDLHEKIQENTLKPEDTEAEIKKFMSGLSEINVDQINSKVKSINLEERLKNNYSEKMIKEIIYLKENNQISEVFTLKDITNKFIDKNINFSKVSVESALNELLRRSIIKRVDSAFTFIR